MTTGRINQVASFLDFGPSFAATGLDGLRSMRVSKVIPIEGLYREQPGAEAPQCPLNFPHPRAPAVALCTDTATTTVRGHVRDTGSAFEVHFAAAEPQGGKGRGQSHETFRTTGRQHRNQGS